MGSWVEVRSSPTEAWLSSLPFECDKGEEHQQGPVPAKIGKGNDRQACPNCQTTAFSPSGRKCISQKIYPRGQRFRLKGGCLSEIQCKGRRESLFSIEGVGVRWGSESAEKWNALLKPQKFTQVPPFSSIVRFREISDHRVTSNSSNPRQ